MKTAAEMQLRQEALAALREGRADMAIAQLRSYLEHAPNDADAHALLGLACSQAGRELEAMEALERAAELKPLSATIHFNRARLLDRLGRLQPAIDAYRQTLKLDPMHTPAQERLRSLGVPLQLSEPEANRPSGEPAAAKASTSRAGAARGGRRRRAAGSPIAADARPEPEAMPTAEEAAARGHEEAEAPAGEAPPPPSGRRTRRSAKPRRTTAAEAPAALPPESSAAPSDAPEPAREETAGLDSHPAAGASAAAPMRAAGPAPTGDEGAPGAADLPAESVRECDPATSPAAPPPKAQAVEASGGSPERPGSASQPVPGFGSAPVEAPGAPVATVARVAAESVPVRRSRPPVQRVGIASGVAGRSRSGGRGAVWALIAAVLLAAAWGFWRARALPLPAPSTGARAAAGPRR